MLKQKKKFGDNRDEVVEWYNNQITTKFREKKKQLYLYGPPNSGKSTFIDLMFGNFFKIVFIKIVFLSLKINFFLAPWLKNKFKIKEDENFCMSGWDPAIHKWIQVDEAKFDQVKKKEGLMKVFYHFIKKISIFI